MRQLIARGLLRVDLDGFGALKMDESCRPLLRGETRVLLRRQGRPVRRTRSRSVSGESVAAVFDPAQTELWEALRACRRRLADAQGLPPYVIFHDATLREMVQETPANLEQLARISGVGVAKLERYGDEFLSVIRQHIQL